MRNAEQQWAEFLGLPRYSTGLPCHRGHVAERYTKGSDCVVCVQERTYARYHANLDASRTLSRERGRLLDPERRRATGRRYYQRNSDRVKARAKLARDADPTQNRQAVRRWRQRNPDLVKAATAQRRGMKRSQSCTCCTLADVAAVYARARPFLDEVDHIVPLALGGAHCVKNLQILTIEDHRKKTAADNIAIRAARSNALLVSSG